MSEQPTPPAGYVLITEDDMRNMEVESHKLLDQCQKLSKLVIEMSITIKAQDDEITRLKKESE